MSTGEQKQAMPAPATVETAPIDLEAIINNTLRIRDQEQHERTRTALEEWVDDIMSRAKRVPEDAVLDDQGTDRRDRCAAWPDKSTKSSTTKSSSGSRPPGAACATW